MTPRATLAYRFAIANTVGAAFLAWAFLAGHAQQVLAGDISHISYVITALFAIGLASSALWVGRINYNAASADYFKAHTAHIGDISEWLVTLGLIGNVVGFVIALRGVDIGALGGADGAQKVAVQLLAGMGVAFYSTLTGAVFALWTSVNRRLIETALNRLEVG